jgi:hypothetical protein
MVWLCDLKAQVLETAKRFQGMPYVYVYVVVVRVSKLLSIIRLLFDIVACQYNW